ncbi:hypothetical protein K437DRAFT_255635 [Tilletiaria anomala UBC 951]|uniref:Transcription initiation factor TFIID subunit 4 n=1 Tax=Tilletiaria anomala (strain ATCC 24038 / CBS 436.72 / UBC 951) TaxID=1037660 RepID=A0A066WBP6_TILAU|nr:uncharacterized protein K437DRAFT_255635 [Tilletiaria anomala UBC 951]KDN48205.1 hypothetical protein K437DRAFT_255635 [Tilletiaria anomala UBC 951]
MSEQPAKKAKLVHPVPASGPGSPVSDDEPLAASISPFPAGGGVGGAAHPQLYDQQAGSPLAGLVLPGLSSAGMAADAGASLANGNGSMLPPPPVTKMMESQHDIESQDAGASISTANFFSQSSQGLEASSQGTTLPATQQGQSQSQSQSQSQQHLTCTPRIGIDPALARTTASGDGSLPTALARTTASGDGSLPTPADTAIAPAASASVGAALGNATTTSSGITVKKEPRDDEGDRMDAREALDVMTGAGVDLKAEQEAIASSSRGEPSTSYAADGSSSAPDADLGPRFVRRPGGDSSAGGLYLSVYDLSFKVHKIAFKHQLQVDPDVLNYLSLATRQRFRNLLETMIKISRHRNWSSHLAEPGFWPDRKGKRRKMEGDGDKGEDNDDGDDGDGEEEANQRVTLYKQEIVSDPELWLSAIEKADRANEMRVRQRRLEREERMKAAIAAELSEASGEGVGAEPMAGGVANSFRDAPLLGMISGSGSKKKAAAAAKHTSADVTKKLADSVAQAAFSSSGASKYSWMASSVGSLGMGPSRSLAAKSASPAGGASSPPASGGDGDVSMADGEDGNPAAGGLLKLPKPRFAPLPPSTAADAGSPGLGARGRLGSGSKSASGIGAWGDFSARQKEREEEERLARVKVTLQDALAALEKEKAGGAGAGSGIATLFGTRALGKPKRL